MKFFHKFSKLPEISFRRDDFSSKFLICDQIFYLFEFILTRNFIFLQNKRIPFFSFVIKERKIGINFYFITKFSDINH